VNRNENRVPDAELLARFVTFRSRVRSDGTVKHDAWMPPKDLELSVTRHASLGEGEIWSRGHDVVAEVGGELFGRADITAGSVRSPESPDIDVVESPIPRNPEHAHVVGWPPQSEKPRQMIIAKRLAAASIFVSTPPTNST
jgi:hypothetical protein